jgi:hypothetical protein
MFKFLRKYNKWILAVGGTLLMIVFLIPTAIQSLSQQAAIGSADWATVGEDQEDVPVEELRRCQADLQLLQRLGQGVPGFGPLDRPEHWYLLVREAEQAGLVGGRASDQFTQEQLETLAAMTGLRNLSTLNRTIGRWLGVTRMLMMYQAAAKFSDNRLRSQAEQLFTSADARIVPIQASADADVPAPTEDELQEHFQQYKDIAPNEGESVFGYRLPDRFKIEWLVVPNEDIRAMAETSDAMSQLELFKHWKRNPNNEPFPEPERGAEIPDAVRSDLLSDVMSEMREALTRFAKNEFLSTLRPLDVETGYYVLPEDWEQRQVKFPQLAERMREEFSGLALPEYHAAGDRWLTFDDLQEFERLRSASTDQYNPQQRTQLIQLVRSLKEFGGDNVFLVQEDVAGPPMRDLDQSLIFFRVTDTDPARAPHDLDEVREEVTQDLKRQQHFDRLAERLDEIEAAARDQGLLATAMRYDSEVRETNSIALYNRFALDFQLRNNSALTPQPTSLPVIGPDEDAVRRIVERALELTKQTRMSELSPAERTFVLPLEDELVLLVVELSGIQPFDAERYTQVVQNNALQSLLLREELGADAAPLTEAFSYETLAARHQFEVKQRQQEEEPTGEDVEPADTATASADA